MYYSVINLFKINLVVPPLENSIVFDIVLAEYLDYWFFRIKKIEEDIYLIYFYRVIRKQYFNIFDNLN